MKKSIALAIAILLFSVPLFAQEKKSTDEYKTLLGSGTDLERIEALEFFAQAKDKSQIPAIIEVLKETDSPKVAGKAAITLGRIGEKGDSTVALKDKIRNDENPAINYACILAIFNIHKKDEDVDPVAKEALSFANQFRSKDLFIADILKKMDSKFNFSATES